MDMRITAQKRNFTEAEIDKITAKEEKKRVSFRSITSGIKERQKAAVRKEITPAVNSVDVDNKRSPALKYYKTAYTIICRHFFT